MFKNSKPYLLATILIGMGLANLFRSLDAVHHTINLLGLTLLLYSLLFKKWIVIQSSLIRNDGLRNDGRGGCFFAVRPSVS